ncbi:hypothetical protein K20_133 [Salmonella phage Kenya-K20]|nr:hypothetical protein K20_133 [Salmonella phage Kenya-K20]WCZ58117.1 hypothetical protein K44_131 [Salmonella phage Kenya-K44]
MAGKAIPYVIREKQILEICEKEGYIYKGVVGEFKNSESKIVLECTKDGNCWSPSIRNFVNAGSRCPRCCQTRFLQKRKDKITSVENIPTTFYIQRLFNNHYSVLKYGITTRSLDTRIKEQSKCSSYSHELVLSVQLFSRKEAFRLETLVKQTIPSGFLTPALLPDGYSETCLEKYLPEIKRIVYDYMFPG